MACGEGMGWTLGGSGETRLVAQVRQPTQQAGVQIYEAAKSACYKKL